VPDLVTQLLLGILVFLGVLLLIALSNWRALRRLGSFPLPRAWPSVSILLPARNEAENITTCVSSLLAQDYPHFEVLVLDDASQDDTCDLLAQMAARDARLRVQPGLPLPAGWLGKHWACHQLAEAAPGALWLFTDADTVHQPGALRSAVAALLAEQADLVTGLPRQDMRSWGERLVVSLLPWSLLCFYPLALAARWPWPPLVMAVGQFMLFRAEAYQRTGGHAAVRAHATDDIALAQRLVAHGGRWRLLDAGDYVSCRMYRGFGQAFRGFSRTLFAAFGYNAAALAAIWLWLALVFLAPPVLLALALAGVGGSPGLPLAAVGLALALWGLAIVRLRLPLVLLAVYPLSVGLGVCLAVASLAATLTGKVAWKGRPLAAHR
jgi:chlorobactene glucosyltransferase